MEHLIANQMNLTYISLTAFIIVSVAFAVILAKYEAVRKDRDFWKKKHGMECLRVHAYRTEKHGAVENNPAQASVENNFDAKFDKYLIERKERYGRN